MRMIIGLAKIFQLKMKRHKRLLSVELAKYCYHPHQIYVELAIMCYSISIIMFCQIVRPRSVQARCTEVMHALLNSYDEWPDINCNVTWEQRDDWLDLQAWLWPSSMTRLVCMWGQLAYSLILVTSLDLYSQFCIVAVLKTQSWSTQWLITCAWWGWALGLKQGCCNLAKRQRLSATPSPWALLIGLCAHDSCGDDRPDCKCNKLAIWSLSVYFIQKSVSHENYSYYSYGPSWSLLCDAKPCTAGLAWK